MIDQLRAPFHPDDLEWRIGQVSRSGDKASVLAYLTSRAVMDRLDDVVGCGCWQNEYRPGPDGGIVCGIAIKIGDGWVWKWDGAENTNIEAVKGGLSDSFKRAAVKWGIGRYLYRLEARYMPIQDGWAPQGVRAVSAKKGNGQWGYVRIPDLPAWAMPRAEPTRRNAGKLTLPDVLMLMRGAETMGDIYMHEAAGEHLDEHARAVLAAFAHFKANALDGLAWDADMDDAERTLCREAKGHLRLA